MTRPSVAVLAMALLGCGVLCFGGGRAWAVTSVSCASPATVKPEPTEYFVSLADHAQHIAHVSIRLPQGEGTRTLAMPVWNALYQVRNFAANVQDVRARDASGAVAQVRNTTTSEWTITAPPGCVVITYDVHLDVPGPFGSTLSAERGFFNWAMVLMYAPSLRSQPVSLRLLDVPATWGLRDVQVLRGAEPGNVGQVVGVAPDYDELVDSPAMIGTFRESKFQQDGATYHLVVDGDPGDYDMAKLDEVLARITHAAVDWMQDRPYQEYTFLLHLPHGPGGGGMEHSYGTAIEVNANRMRESLLPLASLSAHEFFHLWNVKRIRPQSLEPVDYQHENDTRALWFSEGVTSTAGNLLLVRAGLMDENLYLSHVADEITELQLRPAHRWQSAEDSSLDAWFEGNAYYRSPERSISYYNKGEILGILLDLRLRQITHGEKSLRDLLQWMNEHYARQHRFFPDSQGVEEAAEAVAGKSFADFFRDYVSGVEEIPYDDFFRFAGLQVVSQTVPAAAAGFTTTANLGGQPEVVQVDLDGDAHRAGIAPGDRVIAIDGKPADASLDDQLSHMLPGTTVHLRIENRKGQRDVRVQLGLRQQQTYKLQDLPSVSQEQRAHRTAWIHGDDESRGTP